MCNYFCFILFKFNISFFYFALSDNQEKEILIYVCFQMEKRKIIILVKSITFGYNRKINNNIDIFLIKINK